MRTNNKSWEDVKPYVLLVGKYTGGTIIENSIEIPKKLKTQLLGWGSNSTPSLGTSLCVGAALKKYILKKNNNNNNREKGRLHTMI